jgi:hypothetical protein
MERRGLHFGVCSPKLRGDAVFSVGQLRQRDAVLNPHSEPAQVAGGNPVRLILRQAEHTVGQIGKRLADAAGRRSLMIDRLPSSQSPASIISRATPMSSHTSSVRGVTPMARQRTLCRASSPAMVKPTVAAPTTRTSAMTFSSVRRRWILN